MWQSNFKTWSSQDIYGTKHSVNPPLQNLQSSVKSTLETENIDFECVTIEARTCRLVAKIRNAENACSDNILNFLKKEADEENLRYEEMTLEQRKLQRRKGKSRGPK